MSVITTHVYIGGEFSNGLVSGCQLAFSSGDYSSVNDVQSVTLDGQKLQIDELYVHLNIRRTIPQGSAAEAAGPPPSFHGSGVSELRNYFSVLGRYWFDLLSAVSYRTPVWYTQEYPDGTTSIRKYYWKCLEREQTGPLEFDITAQSDIGILDSVYSNGGLYNGEILKSVLADLIGGSAASNAETNAIVLYSSDGIIPYAIDAELAEIPVHGWLPAKSGQKRQSVRDNLHALVLALGLTLRRDAEQNLWFTRLPTSGKNLLNNKIFQGMSAPLGENVSCVEITEHQFFESANDETVTLFDNTINSDMAENTKILFDKAPCYDLRVMKRTIVDGKEKLVEDVGNNLLVDNGPNYAVLNGSGILTGKVYAHTLRIVSAGTGNNTEGQTATVDNIGVINALNSVNVCRRLYLLYNKARTVSMSIKRNGEKPGDLISFSDIYGDSRSGYLTEMDNSVTSFERSECQILTASDKELAQIRNLYGNIYHYSRILTGSGSFTVPEFMDGEMIRVILIGGGSGGASGIHGQDGADGGNSGAKGGVGGSGGEGGKIRIVDVQLSAGEQFSFSCGSGGMGGQASDTLVNGVYTSVPGNPGADSSFGEYNTRNAAHSILGQRNPLTGIVYATPGVNGVAGGKSGPSHGDETVFWNTLEYEVTVEVESGIRKYEITAERDTRDDLNVGVTAYVNGEKKIYLPGERGRNKVLFQDDVPRGIGWGGSGGGAAVGSGPDTLEWASMQGGNAEGSEGIVSGGDGGNGASAWNLYPVNDADLLYGCGGSGGNGGGAGGLGGKGYNDRDGSNGRGGSGSDGQNGADGAIFLLSKSVIPDSAISQS